MVKRKPAKNETPGAIFRGAMLCDAIRQEASGKFILIGCYSGGITLHRRPTIFQGIVFGYFEILATGEHSITYRVRSSSFEGEGMIISTNDAKGGLSDFQAPFLGFIEDDDILLFDWKFDDGEWSFPIRWTIKFSPNAEQLSDEHSARLRDQFHSTAALDHQIE